MTSVWGEELYAGAARIRQLLDDRQQQQQQQQRLRQQSCRTEQGVRSFRLSPGTRTGTRSLGGEDAAGAAGRPVAESAGEESGERGEEERACRLMSGGRVCARKSAVPTGRGEGRKGEPVHCRAGGNFVAGV